MRVEIQWEKVVDELREVLELASEEELQQVTQILFCRRFNPLDYWHTPTPMDVQSLDWQGWLDSIEKRFRFLAADGFTVLRRQSHRLNYRDILIQVCRYLKIPYSQSMDAITLESEIFLHLLQKSWQKLPPKEQNSLKYKIINALVKNNQMEALPVSLQHDPLKILATGGSLVAVNNLIKPLLLQKIAQQFALHFATYQVTKNALVKGSLATANQLQSYVTLKMAQRGMLMASARYTAVRGLFAFLTPALWACFFVDLGWRAIATNYSRIIPVIFTLAQIRLIRGS